MAVSGQRQTAASKQIPVAADSSAQHARKLALATRSYRRWGSIVLIGFPFRESLESFFLRLDLVRMFDMLIS